MDSKWRQLYIVHCFTVVLETLDPHNQEKLWHFSEPLLSVVLVRLVCHWALLYKVALKRHVSCSLNVFVSKETNSTNLYFLHRVTLTFNLDKYNQNCQITCIAVTRQSYNFSSWCHVNGNMSIRPNIIFLP